MTTIEIAYGNSIVFKDTNTVTWSKSRSQNCVVTVEANAKFNPCQTLLTGMKMNVSCESVNPKDTICAAIAKLQCQIDSGGGGGSGTVTSVDAGDLNPLFTTAVANPTTDAIISFAAISQNANLFYASPAAAPGIPLFREIVFADIEGLIAEPITQIVYGTGTFIDSSPNFTYDVATNILTLVNTNNASNGIFKSNEQCEINSVFDSAPFLILGILSLDASQALGSVSVTADDGVTNQGAGLRFLGYPAADTFVSLFYQENADTADIVYATKEFVALNSFTGAATSQILRFMEAAANVGGNYFGVKAPDSITTTRTMVWPNDDPVANEVLSVASYIGNVITTQWANAGALIAEPNTQIVYGTGASVDSSSDWTYDVVTNQLTLQSRTAGVPSLQKNDEFFELVSYLNSPPFEIFAIMRADSGGGSVLLEVDGDDGVIETNTSILLETHIIGGEANIQFLFDKGSPDAAAIMAIYIDRVELHGQDTTSEAQQLRFYEGDTAAGSNYFAVKGQDDIITTRTMQWPDDDPTAGEVLSVTSYAANIITTEWASAGALISIGTIDSVAASANGAVISGTSIIMQSASGTVPGLVNITTQTFAGDKTFSASTVSMNKNGTQVLAVGTTSFVFRTTNGGANVQAQAMFDPDNSVSVAGSQGFAFETANGLVFTAANGTRRIARASIKLTNLTNTANSEAGDLIFLTQSGGTAVSQKFRISGLGNIVAGSEAALATNASDGFLYVPSCAGTPNGTPTAYTGKIAVVVDSTNDIMYIYSNGAWVALN